MKTNKLLPYLMLIGATFLWSTNFALGKYLVTIPPLLIGTVRFTVAALIFLPLLIRSKTKFPSGKLFWTLLIMGITGVFLFNPLIYLGLHYTTSINATLINSLTPLTVAILSYFGLKEKFHKTTLLGLFLSIVGVSFIASEGNLSRLLTLQLNLGDMIVLLASIMWAIYTVLVKVSSNELTSVQSTGLGMFFGLIFLIPATTVQSIWQPLPHLSLHIILIMIYLGIFPSVVSFLLWNTAVSQIGPSRAGLFTNLIPAFNIILASQFLHERIYIYHLFGFLLIFVGVLIPSLSSFTRAEVKPRDTSSSKNSPST